MPIRYTADELMKIIEKDGWQQIPAKGGHRQFRHPVKVGKVSISYHKGNITPKTAKSILRQAGLI